VFVLKKCLPGDADYTGAWAVQILISNNDEESSACAASGNYVPVAKGVRRKDRSQNAYKEVGTMIEGG
jgi:hypothetical protein